MSGNRLYSPINVGYMQVFLRKMLGNQNGHVGT